MKSAIEKKRNIIATFRHSLINSGSTLITEAKVWMASLKTQGSARTCAQNYHDFKQFTNISSKIFLNGRTCARSSSLPPHHRIHDFGVSVLNVLNGTKKCERLPYLSEKETMRDVFSGHESNSQMSYSTSLTRMRPQNKRVQSQLPKATSSHLNSKTTKSFTLGSHVTIHVLRQTGSFEDRIVER